VEEIVRPAEPSHRRQDAIVVADLVVTDSLLDRARPADCLVEIYVFLFAECFEAEFE
jgi:hypothetical protein